MILFSVLWNKLMAVVNADFNTWLMIKLHASSIYITGCRLFKYQMQLLLLVNEFLGQCNLH